MITPEVVGIFERLFKAAILVPTMGLIAWWLFTNWLDRTLSLQEALVGYALLAVAFFIGVGLIVRGGWGFLGLLAFLYLALLALACWEYTDWRRRERQRLLHQVEGYREAIERDPENAAAYSFLGETYLHLQDFESASTALTKALELDPTSKRDHKLLKRARERRPWPKWRRLD